MIKTLTIENFQSHTETELQLDPGVNVIVGSSDSGKSAIVRALLWTITNRPGGDGFRTWGELDPTAVTITLDNGVEVCRERGKSINSYWLDDEEFTAFGQEVPPEIQEALNLSEINRQGQHDSAFLLSSTPGEVARVLNRAADLSVIDRTLANLLAKQRACRQEMANAQERKKSLEADRDEALWVREAAEAYKPVVALDKKAEDLESKIHQLSTLLVKGNAHSKTIHSLKDQVAVDPARLEQIMEDFKEVDSTIRAMDSMISNAYIQKTKLKELDAVAKVSTTEIDSLLANHRSVLENLSQMNSVIQRYNTAVTNARNTKDALLTAENNFTTTFPDVCPLCGSAHA